MSAAWLFALGVVGGVAVTIIGIVLVLAFTREPTPGKPYYWEDPEC